ncbi:oligopeptidase A [Candidatus Enterovibrio altilux]|uniref:oligopeptidase A n=1 Tax=Candidatus Enterovibrio altilux TaxID=1927128 RepID=UPI0012380651|nr:oligopeptidase A [Candidatus Enterovibrio luxaltus]
MTNPLLLFTDLPPFSKIKPEHMQPAVEQVVADCRAAVESVLENNTSLSWASVCVPLAESEDRLNRVTFHIEHLHAVVNSKALREAYEACMPVLSDYSTWRGQHKKLYDAYKAIKERKDFASLSIAQQKTITNELLDFELNGISLSQKKQNRFGEIRKRLMELSSHFTNNVLDATMGWSKFIIEESDLVGMPEYALAAAKAKAKAKGFEGFLLTLDEPSYQPVIMYCDNRALRAELYKSYNTRASDRGPNAGKWDNTNIMNEFLQLSYETAHLLGFNNYSVLSLKTKMASSTDAVLVFLNELVEQVKPQGEKDFQKLAQFTKDNFGVEVLEPWDVTYYSKKLENSQNNISEKERHPYFPEKKVISALFNVFKRVFRMNVKHCGGIDVWDDSVSFYNVFDARGLLRGSFYLDLYARENKHSGAWMHECIARRVKQSGEVQIPVAHLICNFNKPIGDKQALFDHDDVVTLFHEFGHVIHHILTLVDEPSVSGLHGVPVDAIEFPSQLLENWCWEKNVLVLISDHVETHKSLPNDMLDKVLAAKNFQSSFTLLYQLENALFDFTLHRYFDPKKGARVLETFANIQRRVAVMESPEWVRFPHTFSHIFAGSYHAGYYSYLWAEVLACDAFSLFQDEGVFDSKTGTAFLEHILERGGSEEQMELFERFRGRKLSKDAFLRRHGISS